MKKIIALFLVVVLCFSLTACGTKTATKDEMLAVADEYGISDIQNESVENVVSAKQKFCDKTLLLSGVVGNIKEDHIELSNTHSLNYIVDVYLSTEEIAVLQLGQSIKVVGVTTDEIIEEKTDVAGTTFTTNHYQMPSAYLVEDKIELTGILKGTNDSYKPAFNIKIGESDYLRLIYFADSVDVSAFEFAQEIKFSAKAVYLNNNWNYYEAEIIE